MTTDPEVIRADIERTRHDLSQNVDALGEAVRPGNVARHQASKVTGRASALKDRVMGSVHDTAGSGADAASGLKDQASAAPHQVAGRTRSNPLAMGVIALGAGWLLGSLFPGTEKEAQLASSVKEQAQPLVEKAQEAAQESLQNLKEPAQDAAASVTDRAKEAVENVKGEGRSATADLKDTASSAGSGG